LHAAAVVQLIKEELVMVMLAFKYFKFAASVAAKHHLYADEKLLQIFSKEMVAL
jgi:hypothetical protein